jgi:uncharacterized membrane protein YphA (DoxX/SURF4 family)
MSMQNTGPSLSWLNGTDAFAAQWQDFLILVGRVMFGLIFVLSGWRKLMDIPAFAATMPRRDLPAFLGYVAPRWSSSAASCWSWVWPPATSR